MFYVGDIGVVEMWYNEAQLIRGWCMSGFKERLKIERDDLAEKLDKLITFIESDNFKRVDEAQSDLMVEQRFQMGYYKKTLERRLALL